MILYNKTATKYGYTRGSNGISTYGETGVSFPCNVQPLTTQEFISAWFDSSMVYKVYRLYCEYSGVVVGDKLSIDWTIYIVKSVQRWDGLKRKFYKLTISESEWA